MCLKAIQPTSTIRLKKGCETAIRAGQPWVYSGDIIESSEQLLVPPGSLVTIESYKGEHLGIGYFNAASPIACRVLALGNPAINQAFFAARLRKALAARESQIPTPFYRLIHSEADGMPGLLLDRFGSIIVGQIGTAGMERLMPLWLAALEEVVNPQAILLRNDTSARLMEGLPKEIKLIKGEIPEWVQVQENNTVYLADLHKGQKTGWFFDQRDNHKLIADLAQDKTVLDIYSHSGGFALAAAKAGAAHVTLLDSSALALELAKKAAALNGVGGLCGYLQGDAFALMQKLHKEGKQYDIVIADPPAFVKSRKDIAAGMKGYQKVAALAAPLVADGGLLYIASCSHHAAREKFNQMVLAGIRQAGADARILKQTGAAPDHPLHPQLPQSEYLKGVLLRIHAKKNL